MTKVVMNGVVINDNHGHGALFEDVEFLKIENGEFSRNKGPGLTVRNSVQLPDDLANAIRAAAADGQTKDQIGANFGKMLADLGVPVAALLTTAANTTQLLQYLGINP